MESVRVGDIVPQTIQELALKVKSVFALDSVRLVRYNHDNPLVSRVAICGGSGQGFYKDALKRAHKSSSLVMFTTIQDRK